MSPYSKGTVRVGVLPLQRRGKLMRLTVVLTPTAEPGGRSNISLFDLLGQHTYQPTLLDSTNLKLYTVVRTTAKGALNADDVETVATSGSPLYAWAVFAAPQDAVSTMDVQVSGNLGSFTNVPIR